MKRLTQANTITGMAQTQLRNTRDHLWPKSLGMLNTTMQRQSERVGFSATKSTARAVCR